MRMPITFVFAAGLVVLFSSWAMNEATAGSNEHAEKAQKAGASEKARTPERGFLLPYISPSRGRKLFASKGCVVCHSINGVGGEDAPSLVSANMAPVMDPFDFAASMWRGAATMISMQQEELGEQIEFTGGELADIIAFVHSADEQKKFSEDDIPTRIKKLMGHLGTEDEKHEKKEHVNE